MRAKVVPAKYRAILRGLLLSCGVALVIWVVLSGVGTGGRQDGQSQPQKTTSLPAESGSMAQAPPPESTGVVTVGPSPSVTVVPTPTVRVWPSPVFLGNITITTMDTTSEVGTAEKSTIDRTEPISQFIWAPTGDKLLYLTLSGDLYWSNTDGSNATLLYHYDQVYDQLTEQMPMTNTLLIEHFDRVQPNGVPEYSHLDVIKFTPGQPPTFQHGPEMAHTPRGLRWWSATRASGFAHTGEDGGDLLVTVDQDGNLIDEINVPYMIFGAVRPGGEWLAYSTTIQVDNPLDGSSPNTGYLLNLNTGQRLQLTNPGTGGPSGSWSPDGNWFLMSSTESGVAVVSADGHQRVTIPDDYASADAVWSPDSKYLAYAVVRGHSDNGYTVSSWTGAVHIVNVPERKVTDISPGSGSKMAGDSILMWQPKWSRDSAIVSFLSFGCAGECSQLSPAIFHMTPAK